MLARETCKKSEGFHHQEAFYETLDESERPDKCIKCNLCTKNCPQNLKIPELLAKVKDEYDKLKDMKR